MSQLDHSVTLNYSVQTSTRRFFVQLQYALKLLFANSLEGESTENDEIKVELKDWNNDCGVEFDMLERVFPEQLPLSDESRTQIVNPIGTFHKLSDLVLFCTIAANVGASVQVSDSAGETFSLDDECIQIETRNRAAEDEITFEN